MSALSAPRILNEPARWRFSHLSRTSTPILSESERFGRRGVRWMDDPMRAAAARTSAKAVATGSGRSEEHTSELQSRFDLVCRLLLEKKKQLQSRSITQCTSLLHFTSQDV